MRPPIDPELARRLPDLSPLEALLANLNDIVTVREQLELARLASQSEADRVAGVDVNVFQVAAADGSVDVRYYRPSESDAAVPTLLWIHGGGYVVGSAAQDDAKCQALCHAVGCGVVSVDYRLAPEHPYPTPLEDCYGALTWAIENADELGIDTTHLAVGGASAGGGLAAGLALLARDRGEISLCFQLLVYPMLDDRNVEDDSDWKPPIWSLRHNRYGWRAYLGDRFGAGDIPGYAAPARATDLSGLPPAYIPVGEIDLFLDEDLAYARSLQAAGVSAEVHVYPGAFHGFDSLAPDADVARRMQSETYAALRRRLFGPG